MTREIQETQQISKIHTATTRMSESVGGRGRKGNRTSSGHGLQSKITEHSRSINDQEGTQGRSSSRRPLVLQSQTHESTKSRSRSRSQRFTQENKFAAAKQDSAEHNSEDD